MTHVYALAQNTGNRATKHASFTVRAYAYTFAETILAPHCGEGVLIIVRDDTDDDIQVVAKGGPKP